MGSVGDAYDDAMAESSFSTLECGLLARRHSALGYRSPVVYEQETGSEPTIETLLAQAP